MTRMKAFLIVGALLAAGLVLPLLYHAGAARPADEGKTEEKPRPGGKRAPLASRDEEKAVLKAVQGFAAAFNKAELDNLVGLFAEDGEYIHESGKVYRGREALRVMLKKALVNLKGHKHTVKVESTRFVRPEVALVEGTSTVTSPENVQDVGKYSAVLVKQGGKWLFEQVRDLHDTHDGEKPAAYARLKALSWLVGEWHDKDGKSEVKLTCKWGPEQTFLIQEISVKQDDGKTHHLSLRIGWDAANEQVRSWVFDSTGGFGAGWWTREGNSWNVQSEAVYADGRIGSSQDSWKFIDDNTLVWTSKAREADEQPLPDIEMTLVRKTRDR